MACAMQRSRFFQFQSLLWLLIAGVCAGGLAAWSWLENEQWRGVATSVDQPIAWANVPQGGVNLPSLHLESPDVISRTLDTAKAAGFYWLRVQFPWEDIEIHAKNDFRDYRHDYNGDGMVDQTDAISAWTKYDGIVAAAQARNLQLIVRLDRPPSWARQNLPMDSFRVAKRQQDPGSTGPPDNYEDYGDYVTAVVERYRGKIRFFQIWNEPNYGHEWNWADPNPAKFFKLLQLGYTRAKAANPDAIILFPSLTPADGFDWQAMNDLQFLEQLYQLGAADYFDIFTAQGYGLGQPATENRYVRPLFNADGSLRRDTLWQRPLDSRTDVTRVVLLREVMERYGDAHKAVWISEFGWNSSAVATQYGPPVSEEQKAQYLVEYLQRARQQWPWLGAMNIWFLRPGVNFSPEDPTIHFALLKHDWTELPAYTAVKTYLTQAPQLGIGRYQPSDLLWQQGDQYTANWWGEHLIVQSVDSIEVVVDGQVLAEQEFRGELGQHQLEIRGDWQALTISRQRAWWWLWASIPFGLWLGLLLALKRFYRVLVRKRTV